MTNMLFTNVRILDGTGEQPFTGEVLVQGNRILRVGRGARVDPDRRRHRDRRRGRDADARHGRGAHALLLEQRGDPGGHPAHAARGAHAGRPRWRRRYLDAGFTSCVGAACAKPRLDVVMRNAINEGRIPGPRYLAASQEITMVGGLGDEMLPHLPYPRVQLRRRRQRAGGDAPRRAHAHQIRRRLHQAQPLRRRLTGMRRPKRPMSDEEVAMAVSRGQDARQARRRAMPARPNRSSSASATASRSSTTPASPTRKRSTCWRRRRTSIFVAPGLAWLINMLRPRGAMGHQPQEGDRDGLRARDRAAVETMKKMHRRGIRVLPGGDYGFAWTPHGTNAKDLEYFVEHLGFSPMEAIVAATKLWRPRS